jgi:hypothetical protein
MVEHHIQREIIDTLMHNQSVRFKDLKPDGMESNIFMYHLKQLIKEGYVKKTDVGYTLAAAGLTYVDTLSVTNQKLQSQPKPVVILAVHDKQGRWLLAERKIQPYLGAYMLISINQYLGEVTKEHVAEQLHKLAIAEPSTYRGQAEVILYDTEKDILLTHIIGSVHEVVLESSHDLPPETEQFRYVWVDSMEAPGIMPGTKELVAKLSIDQEIFFSFSNK